MASNADRALSVTSGIETLERTRVGLPFGFARAPGQADARRNADLPPLTGVPPAWLRNYWQVTSLGDRVATSYYFFHTNGKIERTATKPPSRSAAPGNRMDAEFGTFGLDKAGTIHVRWEGGDLERIVLGDDGPRSGAVFGLRTSKSGEAGLFAFGALGFSLKPRRGRRAVKILAAASRLVHGLSTALFHRSPLGGARRQDS